MMMDPSHHILLLSNKPLELTKNFEKAKILKQNMKILHMYMLCSVTVLKSKQLVRSKRETLRRKNTRAVLLDTVKGVDLVTQC